MKGTLAALILVIALASPNASMAQQGLAKIKTIVVIYVENRSFDHLYGFFPGANGIANASPDQKIQLDHDAVPLPFFMGAFGGSILNHFWLVCACTPRFSEAPESMRVRLNSDGKLTKTSTSPSARDGAVQTLSDASGFISPDGYAVNTTQPPYQPSGIPPETQGNLALADPKGTPSRGAPLPTQNNKSIG